jgi:glycosyltransferase involved in cell wall biosynthesis
VTFTRRVISEGEMVLQRDGNYASTPPVLSVVIACYNAEMTLGEQLEALAEQVSSEPWEVIVVNNRCTDRSMEIVDHYRGRMPNLRRVDALEKQGTAYAMNVGVRAARANLLAFCDADDVVARGWVAGMTKALSSNEFVSGPHEVVRLNGATLAQTRGNAQVTGVQTFNYPTYLPHAGAGNMGVTRRVFDLVGGFDETMSALFDTDFCWKVQLAGVALCAAPEPVLHVRYRASVMALIRQAHAYGEWNVFIYKRYRAHGMPALDWKHGVRAWIAIVLRIGSLFDSRRRAAWLWELAWRYGRLMGCIKWRVLAL